MPPSRWILAAIAIAFLVLRLPLMFRQYGGQDEDCYAVPGLTVAREGIPRLPYAPARNRDSYYYRIDQALFAEPPLSFYWQGVFFLVLPACYGTARLASATAGLAAVLIVYQLGRRLFGNEAVGLSAAALYSLSRLFFFPATAARPDMLCGMFGVAALLSAWHWSTTRRRPALALTGVLLGLGLLSHPAAVVYCVQVGVWVLWASRGRRRLAEPALLAACALATLALWTPLIAAYPEEFRFQFYNNLFHPAAPGLVGRVLWPWESLRHHFHQLVEHAQLTQLALMSLGLLTASVLAWRRRCPGAVLLVWLTWSACYLLATMAGVRPSKGYWCYPGALLMLCVAYSANELGRSLVAAGRWRRAMVGLGGALLAASLLPGSGVRTWVAHLRHWSDPNYCAPRFVRGLLAELPVDARLAVDPAFVLDAYAAGRDVVLATTDRTFFDMRETPYDDLIIGPVGRQLETAKVLGARYVRVYGDPSDPFACFAQVYVPGPK